MLKLLLSRDQSCLTRQLLETAATCDAGCGLVLVPDQYSHMIERRLCALGGDDVSQRAEVVSFSRLAQRVFQELGGAARPTLDQGGRILLMHLAVRQLAPHLQAFRQSGTRVGFLTQLLQVADECKSCCITPELLMEAAENGGGVRLRELSELMTAYDALTAGRAEDPRDRLTRLADTLRNSHYLQGRQIYLLGFTDFTPQEKLVLSVMLRQAACVTAALRCDTLEEVGAQPFDATRRTALGLIALASAQKIGMEYEVLSPGEERPAELCWLEQGLFADVQTPFPAPCGCVVRNVALSPYRELEQVAEEILHLVREEGLRFRDITVTARSMEGWSERMESVFRRYGIPVFLSRMDNVLHKPVLTLLTSALSVVSNDYEYEDLFRYLKTGLTGIDREDVDELENYVLLWNIRGSRWHSDQAWHWHPEGYGRKWDDKATAEVERLDRLRRKIAAPLEGLRKAGGKTGRDWALAVYDFLEAIHLPDCLAHRSRELRDQGAPQQAEEYRLVWGVLIAALEQCQELLGEDSLRLEEFADLLELVLSQYQVGSIPVSLDRVTCGDLSRISHGSCKVLFLVGADDETLPSVKEDGGLLTDEDRRILTRLGAETTLDADGRLNRELLLIYEGCTLPTRRLYVSYAATGAQGGEKHPSFLMQRLEALFPTGTASFGTVSLPTALRPALDLSAARGDRGLLNALKELPGGELAERALTAMDARRENLTPETVQALYGDKIRLSATRLDKVKSCHYSYFLQYGLRARPRKAAGLEAPEAGTFIHFVLEYVLSSAKALGGIKSCSQEEIHRLAEEATQRFAEEKLGGMENQTPRMRYLFRRLADSSREIVKHMVEELRCSEFEPLAFELGFGDDGELPPVQLTINGLTVSITGIVDRVDGWVHDGKLYVRVMDYKTGAKKFNFADVWYGLNLQMLLYLFTLQEKGLPGYDLPITPSGVLYVPAREALLKDTGGLNHENRMQKLDAELRRSGLVLNQADVLDAMEHIPPGEPARFLPVKTSKSGNSLTGDQIVSAQQLGLLHKHVTRVLRDITTEIGGGNIQADPWYQKSDISACTWCDYSGACHFQDGCHGDRWCYHLDRMDAKAFWSRLENNAEEKEVQAQ